MALFRRLVKPALRQSLGNRIWILAGGDHRPPDDSTIAAPLPMGYIPP